MLKTVTAFNLRKKALIFEEQQTKKSDLDASLSVFRLSIPDHCPLWTSKIALTGEKPTWLHKDEPNFADFAYLKTATDFKTGTLIIDIDQPVADTIEAIIYSTLNAPIPNLIIKNRANKHVQLVYCLKNWVCIDTSNKKGNYSAKAHSLYKALKRHLNAIFGGDDAYHNFIAKNPYSEQWDVVGMRSTSYEMYELARISELEVKSTTFIERLQSKQTDKALKQASDRATVKEGERNEFLFNTVRVRAYSLYNKHSKNWTRQQFENCLNDFANELNETKCSPPVQVSEVATICHSITNYCYGSFGEKQRMTKSEISAIAAKCGKKGGKAKGYAYSKQRQEARRLHKRGKKATDIAKLTGLSIRSVYNAINESKSRKTAIKTEKTNVQENEFKNIKYQILKPIFNANNYQCSVFSVKELRSNSPFVCERSELQSLNLLFLKQNTQTILLANRNFYFCFSPPQITHDLI
ncbi:MULTISPECIES: replication initiation protein [Acinetobacter]|nr:MULTISPECIES: replication initiation protein [Acinetobacter]MCT9408062.1 replication initiation protein [Acinetobacter baumannii]MCU4451324.1 replication initiation protein [Acinetobacter lwoffii]MCU4616713.1 replication initiation protein [Acinetobacter lwoffii]VLX00602.1 Replicase family [Streptococcus pneumoniae]